jgi:hypothetical protein
VAAPVAVRGAEPLPAAAGAPGVVPALVVVSVLVLGNHCRLVALCAFLVHALESMVPNRN